MTLLRLALLSAVFGLTVVAGPDPREFFARAHMLDEQNQNLEEAIRLYGRVAQLTGAPKSLAAEARYRQGLVYQRLGRNAEAEHAFRLLIRDFPDQGRLVAMARAKLPRSAPRVEMGNHRVWFGPEIDDSGSPSPDGRWLSFTDWATGDLAIRSLETQETRHITHKGLPWRDSSSYASWSIYSPDGERLAYTWIDGDGTGELRIVSTRTAQSHTVYRPAAGQFVRAEDWAPDGKSLVAEVGRGDTGEIILVSLTDGHTRTLPSFPHCFLCDRILFSSDSRFVFYDSAGEHGGILVISLSGNRTERLLQHPARESLIGRSPDGKLLFASDRSGRRRLWSVAVQNGKAVSDPKPVWPETDVPNPLGITRDGSLYYSVSTDQTEIYLASVDLARGEVTAAPKPISNRYVGTKRSFAWSPDGKLLAYLAVAGVPRVVILNLESGDEHEILPQHASLLRILQWSPDQNVIFIQGRAENGPFGVYALSLAGGEVTLVAQGISDRPVWSPDGRTIYYGGPAIFAREAGTRATATLYRGPDPGTTRNPGVAVSPDGKQLLIQLENDPRGWNRLALLPASGGEPRTLITFKDLLGGMSLNWTPDGQRILYSLHSGNHAEIWITDLRSGGKPQRIGIGATGRLPIARLSPDGKRLAYMVNRVGDEVWVMEHFLEPAITRKKRG
jgi:Tol biopolymer transport system component